MSIRGCVHREHKSIEKIHFTELHMDALHATIVLHICAVTKLKFSKNQIDISNRQLIVDHYNDVHGQLACLQNIYYSIVLQIHTETKKFKETHNFSFGCNLLGYIVFFCRMKVFYVVRCCEKVMR